MFHRQSDSRVLCKENIVFISFKAKATSHNACVCTNLQIYKFTRVLTGLVHIYISAIYVDKYLYAHVYVCRQVFTNKRKFKTLFIVVQFSDTKYGISTTIFKTRNVNFPQIFDFINFSALSYSNIIFTQKWLHLFDKNDLANMYVPRQVFWQRLFSYFLHVGKHFFLPKKSYRSLLEDPQWDS